MPQQYIPAVEKGVREAMAEGVLAGYPVVDVRVDALRRLVPRRRLLGDGLQDRRLAWPSRRRFTQAKPVLLEPIMRRGGHRARSYMGDVIGDLNKKRGRILRHGARRRRLQLIEALVPHGRDAPLRHRPALHDPGPGRTSR